MRRYNKVLIVFLGLQLLLLQQACKKDGVDQAAEKSHSVAGKKVDKTGSSAEKVGGKILGGLHRAGEKLDQGVKKVDQKLRSLAEKEPAEPVVK